MSNFGEEELKKSDRVTLSSRLLEITIIAGRIKKMLGLDYPSAGSTEKNEPSSVIKQQIIYSETTIEMLNDIEENLKSL